MKGAMRLIRRLIRAVRRVLARWSASVPALQAPLQVPFIPSPNTLYHCLNGPVQGAKVEAPFDATPGTACALPWRTVKGATSYAVYMLVDYNGAPGLMFLKNYSRPEYAQAKVQRLTAICAGAVA